MLFCKGRSWLLFDRSLLQGEFVIQFVGSQKRGTVFVPKTSGTICNLCTFMLISYIYIDS